MKVGINYVYLRIGENAGDYVVIPTIELERKMKWAYLNLLNR